MDFKRQYDFKAGEVLLVNKPLNWTSFDVVNKIRWNITRRLGVKKIKVGHAGTLDPLADGLLIICTGKKTKEIESYMGLEKAYSGTITLGSTTPSYDLETAINERFDLSNLDEQIIREQAAKMTGEIDQLPPQFSAKKIGGKKAYDFARKGEVVELKPKRIQINEFRIDGVDLPNVNFFIRCSKGTYIRSIAHDMGVALDNGGHLSKLRRESIGEFQLSNAIDIDPLVEFISESDMINIESI